MSQMNKQHTAPEKELNGTDEPPTRCRVQNTAHEDAPRSRENDHKEIGNVKMEMQNIKKNRLEIKNTITEMKSTSQGIGSGLDEAEGRIGDLEDAVAENTQAEQKKKKIPPRPPKNEGHLRGLWDNI